MKIEIKSRWQGTVLFSVETAGIKAALEIAVKQKTNLRGADLGGANLRGADLRDADLRRADLGGARLETGETLEEYRREVVPALLAAGGHPVPEAAWAGHSWQNCPMATAFAVDDLAKIPPLHRPRAAQFVRLYDAGIPVRPEQVKERAP